MKKKRKHSVRSQLGDRVDVLDELGMQMEYFPRYYNLQKGVVEKEMPLAELEVVLLSIFLSGEGTHYIGDQSFQEKGVSIGITYYGVGHNILTSPDGMEIMNFYIDLNVLKYPDISPDLQPYLKTFLPYMNIEKNPLLQMVRIEFSNPEVIRRLTFNMYEEFKNKPKNYADSLQLYFKLFLMECCRSAKNNGVIPYKKKIRKKFEVMESLRLYLVENYQKEQSLEELIKIFPIDKSYMCRLFKEYMGKSIFDYLLDLRLERVLWLLKTTEDKILYIAIQSGFTDLAYFNRQFKSRLKISPSQYRQQMKII